MDSTASSYQSWLEHPGMPAPLREELLGIREKPEEIKERFYKGLSFGTGGLRGIMGAGSNRMNEYTVYRATRGMARALQAQSDLPSCAVGFDSRLRSQEFARLAAACLAENGVRVHLFEEICPTPMLSFAVRYLRCDGGLMITASHNPREYNGYKVYNQSGCQLLDDAAAALHQLIEQEPALADSLPDFGRYAQKGQIRLIGQDIHDAFHEAVMDLSLLSPPAPLHVVYTPLHGTGLRPVRRLLAAMPNVQFSIVAAQQEPDGGFPTVIKPNPEDPRAMAMAAAQMQEEGADICLATDPDCDRLGVGLRTRDGVQFLSGTQLGELLLHFVLEARQGKGLLPVNAVAVKTIVTSAMAPAIARHYQLRLVDVLTGFKYIGEVINRLEREGALERFVLAFEDSNGYLSGTHVREKDGVNAVLLTCEMASYYKSVGMNLLEAYEALAERFGRFEYDVMSLSMEGPQGAGRIARIMSAMRAAVAVADLPVEERLDYLTQDTGLPRSNVLLLRLQGGCQLIMRPSGTEPLLKLYLSQPVSADTQDEADKSMGLGRFRDSLLKELEAYGAASPGV